VEDLRDRVVVVTGASRGIGKGLAIGLAALGARVVCAARTVQETPGGLPGTIGATVDTIAAAGGEAIPVQCDIGIAADIERLVASTLDAYGRLDVLVNNAMAPTRAMFADATVEEWDESMRVNVRSLFLTTKAVVPPMAKQGGGSIINISSGGAEHASQSHLPPGYMTYAVAKAALERFSSAAAPELQPLGITIHALRPGAVKTELATRELGEDYDWSGWGTPDAVVPAVAYLATQIGPDATMTGRIVDSTQFGVAWP
jgi:NAD(P)-dependent dehydrogenase (short-subunit alcohol dehydrogenase family)